MLKIVGLSFSVLLCTVLIKDKNRSIAVLLSLAGGVMLFLAAAGELKTVVDSIKEFSSSSETSDAFIKLMLKALGITLITQFVSDVCRDNGENALASGTEFAAKLAVVAMLLPLFETVLGIVGGLVR
ncbi:MAG: hypothetical protein E7571_04395 [Ruminococcaceae bacterium]|nr:hypothetical protein [Oscillospiraceae bacterium]